MDLSTTKDDNKISFRFKPEEGKTPEDYINELVEAINKSEVCGLVKATKTHKPTKILNLKTEKTESNESENTGTDS